MDGKIAAYRKVDTMGKSQIDLILMVYDGALKSLRAAGAHYRKDDFESGHSEIEKTRKFVTHLYTTLDQKKGGEVAENLGKMYSWVLTQLYAIAATKDQEQIKAIQTVLGNLRSGWADLKAQELATPTQPSSRVAKPVGSLEIANKFVTNA